MGVTSSGVISMAKIAERKPKERSGGYDRLFGVSKLGELLSKIQGAVISSGSELERMIIDQVQTIDNLDDFLKKQIMPEGVYIAPKQQVKKCRTLQFPQGEPDFLIFKRRDQKQYCYVVELKDGHMFDTKKSQAEYEAMQTFIQQSSRHLPFQVQCYFCAFNQENRDAIVKGFKGKIKTNEAITGRGFCELLEIDYDEIVESRKSDQPENLRYFLSELVKIKEVRVLLKRLLKNGRK